MGSELKNALDTAGRRAQYDLCAKRLLGQKIILSHILVNTVEEFRGMSPKDVVPLIEGEAKIGAVRIEPGMTNRALEMSGERIVGLNTESAEIYEGEI